MFNFDPLQFISIIVALVLGIAIHEFSHAWSAYMLGDSTAKNQGRLTLNPIVHFDPLGFMLLIFLALGFFGITWGRPVPVNPYNLRGGRRGMAITAFAGPASNVVIATAFAIPWRLEMFNESTLPLAQIAAYIVVINILLAVFNLIPVPPLDGFNIMMGLVPNFWVPLLAPIQKYGVLILMGLIFMGPMLGINLLGQIVGPPQQLLTDLLLGGHF